MKRISTPVTPVALGVLLALACSSRSAPAQPKKAQTVVAAGDAVEGAPVASALSLLADAIAKGLGTIPARSRLAVAPIKTDDARLRGRDLGILIASAVGSRLAASPLDEVDTPLGKARALAASSLVFVEPELIKGTLRLSASLYVGEANGWERAKSAVLPPPRGHAFAARPIDAEIRSFLPPIDLEKTEVHKARHDESSVVAAACGDLDGDGGLELAIVGTSRMAIGKLERGRFVASSVRPWSRLAAQRSVPLREPIGTANIVAARSGRTSLVVGTTTHGGVSLTSDEAVAPAALGGIPVLTAGGLTCASVALAHSALEGPAPCAAERALAGGNTVASSSAVDYRFDTASSFVAVDRTGVARAVTSLREPNGRLHVNDGVESRILEGVGADVVVFDFDLDGVVDVAVSSSEAEEAVSLYSFTDKGVRLRKRFAVPTPVRALAACPAEALGAPGLLVVTDAEVWLVR